MRERGTTTSSLSFERAVRRSARDMSRRTFQNRSRSPAFVATSGSPIEQSAELIALQKRVKSAFDPQGVLNPGKIFAPEGHKGC